MLQFIGRQKLTEMERSVIEVAFGFAVICRMGRWPRCMIAFAVIRKATKFQKKLTMYLLNVIMTI